MFKYSNTCIVLKCKVKSNCKYSFSFTKKIRNLIKSYRHINEGAWIKKILITLSVVTRTWYNKSFPTKFQLRRQTFLSHGRNCFLQTRHNVLLTLSARYTFYPYICRCCRIKTINNLFFAALFYYLCLIPFLLWHLYHFSFYSRHI